ncbi:MAG: Uma2 family endonuclease [Leptolyngbyaceae bacterium]|nr:Uma2 family endonuclease [Leptolyngbyaceae bacterium]
MIAQPQPSQVYSPEKYLDFETASEQRHEFLDGEVLLRIGGTPNHNQILLNIAGALNFELQRKPYRVFAADQRLWIPQRNIYTYPDVMVIHGELDYQQGRKDTLMNPLVMVEVLSKSTQNYDRGETFVAYRTIPSFQEYVLVDQYTCHVVHYAKTDEKSWIFKEYDQLEEQVSTVTLPWAIALTDIYEKVEFEKVEFEPAEPELESEATPNN